MKHDYLLVEWIVFALHQKNLETVVNSIRNNKKIQEIKVNYANIHYLEKIIREEVVKQFSDNRRPVLEVILNSVDARPKNSEEQYIVKVNLKRGCAIVSDNGTSLSLEQILKLLIIPFNTEKEGVEEIGRFGVGFLSTLNYCILENSKVIVKTFVKNEAYKLTFYCKRQNISNLRMTLKKIKNIKQKVGTTVIVTKVPIKKVYLFKYIREHLCQIYPFIAKIIVNKNCINESDTDQWFEKRIELEYNDKIVKQSVAFKREKDHDIIRLVSQGVKVRSLRTIDEMHGATIYFPSCVKVVEGRDEFKLDKNYKKCSNKIFEAFEDYIKDEVQNNNGRKELNKIASFIPSLASAFEMKTIKDIPNISNIKNILINGRKYVLTKSNYVFLRPFLGEFLDSISFTVSPSSHEYWSELYRPAKQLEQDLFRPIAQLELKKMSKQKSYQQIYDFLYEIIDVLPFDIEPQIIFVELDNFGKICTCKSQSLPSTIYMNVKHPHISGNYSLLKGFSAAHDFLISLDKDPQDINQKLLTLLI